MGTMAENDQIGEFKEAFNMFAQGSDKIAKETLKSAMRELGLKPTDEEVTQMIKDADSTGSGKVGFNEFYSMMTEKMSQIDSPADQFRSIMAENHGYKFTDKEVREILKAGEMEGGNFNYEKFISSMGSF